MRAKRDGESTAIAASSPQQALHTSEKHIIVDHERSQVHLVSSTPSTQVPVLNSYHILNTSGLLGNDPRSLLSAHLLASIQQLAAATNNDARYQIPLTIQMPSQLYTPANNIQVSAQSTGTSIQIPQQVLMTHHDLNILNNLTETNLNLLQSAQQPQQQQSQYETLISRLMRGFIDTDTILDANQCTDVHMMPLLTTTGGSTITTTTNSIANNKEAKTPRKYNKVKNNGDNKLKSNSKRAASAMIDSTTTNNSITAAKNKRNKSAVNVNGTGKDSIIIPTPNANYNHPLFQERSGHRMTTEFLNSTPIRPTTENSQLTLIPENVNSKKRKNHATTPKKKEKVVTSNVHVDHSKAVNGTPTLVQSNIINNNNNNREKVFSCPICKRTFGYKHVLQNHERTHTGEKPFECNICSKKFTRDHHLKTHMRLHTGEKPYQCSHCDRQFVQVANLRRHLRVHTGERPYACDICASKFSDSNQLKAHNLIHKGEKPYNCVDCGGKYRRRHHLIHHKCSNSSTSLIEVKMDGQMTPVLGKGETVCTYMVPALSPPLSSSPVAPARSIHSGGSSNSSLCSNGGSRVNGSTKRERKSRETRRIIRPEGLQQSSPTVSPISVADQKSKQPDTLIKKLNLPAEQTQPQDLSFTTNGKFKGRLPPAQVVIPQQQGSILPRHFTGSHSSCSGTSLSSPSPPTSGSHQEDSIFAHCNSEEENGSSSRSSNCSGDEEHHLSGITPPTSCSSNGGDHHNLDKGSADVEVLGGKMDWSFTQFHNARDKFKGDA